MRFSALVVGVVLGLASRPAHAGEGLLEALERAAERGSEPTHPSLRNATHEINRRSIREPVAAVLGSIAPNQVVSELTEIANSVAQNRYRRSGVTKGVSFTVAHDPERDMLARSVGTRVIYAAKTVDNVVVRAKFVAWPGEGAQPPLVLPELLQLEVGGAGGATYSAQIRPGNLLFGNSAVLIKVQSPQGEEKRVTPGVRPAKSTSRGGRR